MPRVEHEPWCEDHADDEFGGGNGSGVCHTFTANFGPLDELPPGWKESCSHRGGIGASRIGDRDPDVYVDYNTTSGGRMDVNALRAVREAVAESPGEFLEALDRLIATLGTDVPSAHSTKYPKSVAS